TDVVVGTSVVTQDIGNFPIVYTGTAAADSYLLRLDAATSTKVEVLVSGVVTYTIAKASVATLTFNLGGADDLFTIDYTNGVPVPAGGVFYDGGAGANDSLVITGSGGNDSVTLSNAFAGPDAGNIAINDRSNGAQT